MIYLDYAATTPISETALHVFNEVSRRYFGNTNSLHDTGTSAKTLYENCKRQLAQLIGGEPSALHFTSGGTDGNQKAIEALLHAAKSKGNHIITTALEHKSIVNYLSYLEANDGYDVSIVPVDTNGIVDINELKKYIKKETVLVSIQHANSEIGVIQPISQIGTLLKEKGILFHCDCVQTFGKIPIDVNRLLVDSLTVSSHKVYGPKGVGAIYLTPSIEKLDLAALKLPYSGTINLPGIASFVAAAQETTELMEEEYSRLHQLRAYFTDQLLQRQLDVEVITTHDQLPHIIGLIIGKIQGDYAMLELNRYGIEVSTGSACTAGMQEPSKTLLAIGKDKTKAKQFIRLSLGRSTSKNSLNDVIKTCAKIIQSFS
ncbi:IscS subfamily cysteine desulfurase [Aquibacillus salsiterrae]|uniref:IscS subfamily cysteine desulfurase n=1 Tax=Aquibacillus salsiterrae TaxID=2950439 RepID=A0A9X3WAK1_9BACI|nr:IscS subfamily cysteine desulfurase [Aquibacillus salsiterrae]MDC3415655.1 IscS subfamily cysteine desulfurase [Aquibacillus salsiterrae]